MHDEGGMDAAHQGVHPGPIANIQVVVPERGMGRQQPTRVPTGIALGPEEVSPHIVVDAVDLPAERTEVVHDF